MGSGKGMREIANLPLGNSLFFLCIMQTALQPPNRISFFVQSIAQFLYIARINDSHVPACPSWR